jgi:hypothetical protein
MMTKAEVGVQVTLKDFFLNICLMTYNLQLITILKDYNSKSALYFPRIKAEGLNIMMEV